MWDFYVQHVIRITALLVKSHSYHAAVGQASDSVLSFFLGIEGGVINTLKPIHPGQTSYGIYGASWNL